MLERRPQADTEKKKAMRRIRVRNETRAKGTLRIATSRERVNDGGHQACQHPVEPYPLPCLVIVLARRTVGPSAIPTLGVQEHFVIITQ